MATHAWYQGHPAHGVRFVRTRGWRADTTLLLFYVDEFPGDFEFVLPNPGELPRARGLQVLSPLVTRPRNAHPQPLVGVRRLEFGGVLEMIEVDDARRRHAVTVDPLFVVGIETVKRDAQGKASVVRARLVDERYFYSRGFLKRWSYNRPNVQGRFTRDSTKPGGEPFALAEMVQNAARRLIFSPEVSRTPDSWRTQTPALELPRFGSASAALVRIAQEYGAEGLCLNFDSSLSLWRPACGASRRADYSGSSF